MPNDILKLGDKRILLAGPITSFSYEIGHSFTTQGASICFFTPDIEKAQRISDTLNDAREIHRNYGRACAAAMDLDAQPFTRSLATAIQSINGLDVFIDAMNFLNPLKVRAEIQTEMLNEVERIFTERRRGRLLLLLDNFLLTQKTYEDTFGKYRKYSSDWIMQNKMSLLQKNIVAHTLQISLTEDCLIFLNPQIPLNESLKKITSEQFPLKISKPDNISKALLAASGDLMSSVLPCEIFIH
jgi:hypothetical protein